MSIRKTRIDKGVPRKAVYATYESWRETFIGFAPELQDRAFDDLELIQSVLRYKPAVHDENKPDGAQSIPAGERDSA